MAIPEQLPRSTPRGTRRILYNSDPSNITGYMFDQSEYPGMTRFPLTSSPARTEELQRYVDVVAAGRADTFVQDVYAQGWTLFFRSEKIEYDQRPQHQRFVPLMDAGVTPLQVLIDQAHRHGMEFFAGFRVNDRHFVQSHAHTGTHPIPQGARWVLSNQHLLIKDMPPGPAWIPGNAQDFTFPEVREYLLSAIAEVVGRFDIQGIHLVFRDDIYFPHPRSIARERQHLMTDLIRRIRDLLDTHRGGRLLLGALVPQTVTECHDVGLDVPGWIAEGLLDWVSPGDVMYSDFNGRFEEFSALTRTTECMLYPVAYPYCAHGDRGSAPLTLENYRALATNYYGAGADGISIFNYNMHWDQFRSHVLIPWENRGIHGPATSHTLVLQYFKELRDPARVRAGARHYLFHRMWAGFDRFGPPGTVGTGAVRDDHVVLRRVEAGQRCEYRFRICEEPDHAGVATLYFCASGLGPSDPIEIDVNGSVVPLERVHGAWHPLGRPRQLGRPLAPFSQCWFDLTGLPLHFGDNVLGFRLPPDATKEGEVVIEEVEVVVLP